MSEAGWMEEAWIWMSETLHAALGNAADGWRSLGAETRGRARGADVAPRGAGVAAPTDHGRHADAWPRSGHSRTRHEGRGFRRTDQGSCCLLIRLSESLHLQHRSKKGP